MSPTPINQAPLKIIYFALIVSTFFYAVIVWVLFGQHTPEGTIEQALRRPEILAPMLLSAAMFALSLFLRSDARPRKVLRWAIIESSSVFALAAAFIARDWRLFVIGWALSLIGFALAFPSDEAA